MGVFCQLWNIRDKINEVDDFIAPDRQATIVRPIRSLIFRKLGNPLRLGSKKLRVAAINASSSSPTEASSNFSKWLMQRYGTGIGSYAVAARDSASRLGSDEVDISGLQMVINC
jgi:hypothetical protein